jgi:hypothetical protein
MENGVQIEAVRVNFRDGQDRYYEIQVSNDGNFWKTIGKHTPGSNLNGDSDITLAKDNFVGIALRLTFSPKDLRPLQITNVEISGRAVVR